jgi:hypothetical protein
MVLSARRDQAKYNLKDSLFSTKYPSFIQYMIIFNLFKKIAHIGTH